MKPGLKPSWATVGAVFWFGFFLALIFKPELVKQYPILAVVALVGCGWWMVQARKTRRREKARLLDPDDRT
ncbi:MAG: hypothetical protein IID40_00425 [Planctomycetes bacterium]|nr:hypothetical protein [Planctomycetota bacterium]